MHTLPFIIATCYLLIDSRLPDSIQTGSGEHIRGRRFTKSRTPLRKFVQNHQHQEMCPGNTEENGGVRLALHHFSGRNPKVRLYEAPPSDHVQESASRLIQLQHEKINAPHHGQAEHLL
jgi:hypothetical protein